MVRIVLALIFVPALCAQENPFMQAYMPRYSTMKQNVVEAAELMPADQYSFKLSPQQRAFGDWIDHTVMLMHTTCAGMRPGAAPAMDHSKHAGSQPKEALVSALKEAADQCDTVLKSMTDSQALTPVRAGARMVPPIEPMLTLLVNLSSHYGNMVGYLRAKDLVPPSTARSKKR